MSVTLLNITGYVQGESSDNISITGSGDVIFVLESDQPFTKAMTVTADAGGGNEMTGSVVKYVASSKQLTINVTSSSGSGSYSSWIIGGTRIIRISNEGYISKGTDVPATTHWPPGIKDPGNFEQFLFSAGTTSGKATAGKGDIIIANADGTFDYLEKIGFSGRTLEIKTLPDRKSAYAEATSIFSGTTFGLDFSWNVVTIKMRDRLEELAQKKGQEAVFEGTNAGSTGYEGSAGGIKGYTKPFAYGGPILEVEAPLVNESTLIYATNYDISGNRIAVNSFDAVYDSGLALALDTGIGTGGDFATTDDLKAATIGAGKYATCLAEGTFRLNSSPAGKITCDFTVGNAAADRTPAAISISILEDRAELSASDYDQTSFDNLDTDTGSMVAQLYVNDEKNILDCVNEVLSSVGASLIVGSDGKFRAVQLKNPDIQTSVATLGVNRNLVESSGGVRKISSRDPGEGLPVKEMRVDYERIYTTQEEDALAGAVSDTRRLFLKNAYRTTDPIINTNVATKHLLSPVRKIETNLTNETDAEYLRDYWNDLFKEERDWFIVRDSSTSIYEIGDTITLQFNRYNLTNGRKCYIMGRVFELARPFVEYYVWG